MTVAAAIEGFDSGEVRARALQDTPARLTLAELMALPEYSTSIPTGPRPGFRWRCRRYRREIEEAVPVYCPSREYWFGAIPPPEAKWLWLVCEYVASDDPTAGGWTVWREFEIIHVVRR